MRTRLPIFLEAAVILIVAVCLGFAYDSTSPLGLRKPATAPAAAAPAPVAAAVAAPAPAPGVVETLPLGVPGRVIQNETISAFVYIAETGISPQVQPVPVNEAGKPLATLTWPEVKPLLAKRAIVLVDVRDTESFGMGTIPGALSLPKASPVETFRAFMAAHPKNTPLVFFCQSLRCPFANSVAGDFAGPAGYTDVRTMPGGYVEYTVAESIAPPAPAAAPAPAPAPARPAKPPVILTWAEVKPLLAKRAVVLVDVRDPRSFAAGSIPGALLLPVDAPVERFIEFFGKHPKNTPFVFFGQGVGSPSARAMARDFSGPAGYTDVGAMPGGYDEWAAAETNTRPPAPAPAPAPTVAPAAANIPPAPGPAFTPATVPPGTVPPRTGASR